MDITATRHVGDDMTGRDEFDDRHESASLAAFFERPQAGGQIGAVDEI
jgi:hypothetical protein